MASFFFYFKKAFIFGIDRNFKNKFSSKRLEFIYCNTTKASDLKNLKKKFKEKKFKIIIDDGAVDALKKGSSLLPAGVKSVEGNFERGDVIEVLSSDQNKIGIGLAGYAAEESIKIMGHKSDEIANILSYSYREEMIHKDDLVLIWALN